MIYDINDFYNVLIDLEDFFQEIDENTDFEQLIEDADSNEGKKRIRRVAKQFYSAYRLIQIAQDSAY